VYFLQPPFAASEILERDLAHFTELHIFVRFAKNILTRRSFFTCADRDANYDRCVFADFMQIA